MNTNFEIARNLSFRHLRAFVCVAHSGSFTRAAKELAISQPALTLNIRQFEEIVGVNLFSRTTRKVALTPCGQEFLLRIEKLLDELDSAILGIRARAQQQENRVDIAVLPSVAIRLIPKAVREYAEVAPDISICMHDDNGRGVQSQVLNRDADFGISNLWQPHSNLEFTPLVHDRVGLICRDDHPLAKKQTPLSWSDLVDYDFVGMTKDTGVHRLLLSVDGLPNTIDAPAFSVLTIAALVGLVESGNAISALPALAAPDYLNPTLVYRDLHSPVVYRQLCLISLNDQPLSIAAQSFKSFMEDSTESLCEMFPNDTVLPGPLPD